MRCPSFQRRRLSLERLEQRLVLDSTLVFNEIFYHPASDQAGLEWIELHNELAIDLDVSRWRLSGGIDYQFTEGTIVPGGGYLVVANDPQELSVQTGFGNSLGPYTPRPLPTLKQRTRSISIPV